MTEIDFPRGSTSEAPKRIHKTFCFIKEKGSTYTKGSRTAKLKSDERSSEPSYENVFRQVLSTELLQEDVRGLGIVKKISETDVVLECAEGILLQLPGNRVSKIFTRSLAHNDTVLEDIFSIGQAVAFKVFKPAHCEGDKRNRKSMPKITTCPYEVNSHLVPSNLKSGLVVMGAISSVEDEGAVIDLGLAADIRGFVSRDDLPSNLLLSELREGQVALFRVKPNTSTSSRVIPLSGYAEMDSLDDQSLHINQLLPGTILSANPEKVVGDGVYVNLGNDVKAFIRKIHLPPRLQYDPSKCIKAFRVCVLCCQQNSPMLILSAHPDVLAISKIEKRILPQEYAIGQKISCRVFYVDKQMNVYFCPDDTEKEKSHLLIARALRIHIDDPEKNISNYSLGSEHICRIIGYNSVDRLLVVTTKSELLKQKIINVQEAQPGNKLDGTVVAIKPNGLTVKIYDDLVGYITTMHTRNKPSGNWQKGYRKDQKIVCRVLYLDQTTSRLILTAKPAMVESTETLITNLEDVSVGDIAVGVVIKVLESGGLVVAFYNHVMGLIHGSEAKKFPDITIGMPVKVRVSKIEPSTKQIFLDFGDQLNNSAINVPLKTTEKKKVKKPAKPFLIYTAKVLGPWKYGGCSSDTAAELLLNGGSIGRLHASEINIGKYTVGSCPMKEFLAKNTGKTINVKVICVGKRKNLSIAGQEKLLMDHQTTRIVECTMEETKMSEPRKKLKLINYEYNFEYGQRIPIFIVTPQHYPAKATIAEVNPAFRAIISHDKIMKVALPSATEPGQEEIATFELLSSGELQFGKVIGVNKTRRGKYLEMSLLEDENKATKKKKANTTSQDEEKTNSGSHQITRPKKRTKNSSVNSDTDSKPDVQELNDEISGKDRGLEISKKRPKFMKVQDATFDWSLAGFTVTDFADVTRQSKLSDDKLVDSENEDDKNDLATLGEEAHRLLHGADDESDFNDMLKSNPNSSELWIRCIAFYISRKNYGKAKEIADRALSSINFSDDVELYNIWKVYLNLEAMFGDEESLKEVFSRACASTNSLRMHKHLAKALKNNSKFEEANEIFELMLKKFRHDDLEVWYLYAEHLLENGEQNKSRDLLQRALQSLDKKHHVAVLCRFAQMEYKYGDAQRGKTLFEKLVQVHKTKIITWSLYIDQILKHEGITETRKIFERAVKENATSGKLKVLFKKWMDVESKYGDEESQNLVRERALQMVEDIKKEEDLE